jgi:hypothetical protein
MPEPDSPGPEPEAPADPGRVPPDPGRAEPDRGTGTVAEEQRKPARPDDEELLGPGDERQFRQDAETIININRLETGQATLGGLLPGRPRATGSIGMEAIRAELIAFCGCESFRQAAKVLREHGIVFLVAGEGSGRYVGALALLAGWPDVVLEAAVISLPPTSSIASLATGPLKPGRRYLVHDMRGDGRASAEQRFELGRLGGVLSRDGVRIVVTADAAMIARRDLGKLAVEWVPPSAQDVLDAHLRATGHTLSAADLATARAHASRLRLPAEVAAFVSRLVKDGVEAAMHSQSDADRAEVRAWFDGERTVAEQLTAAAAGFLHDVPEFTFERCLARLDELMRTYDPDERAPLSAPLTLARSREARSSTEALVATVDGDDPLSERRVIVRSPHMRRHILTEVWNRYGYTVLAPLRRWVGELVADPSADVRVQAALGVALLAEQRWADVHESFLTRWSDEDYPHRAATANALSFMAGNDLLAPRALELVLDWSENQGARRAMTAALTLAGPLGGRYPNKAFEQLWYLTTRGRQIASVARVAMSVMLGAAVDEDRARAMSVLRTADKALHWSDRHATALGRRGSVGTVLALLGARSFDSGEHAVGQLLRTDPATPDLIGPLFAAALASGPHHHDAVTVLRRLLLQMAEADEPLDLAVRLGTAVFSGWTDDIRMVLVPQIQRALAVTDSDLEAARQVISSFIHSIDPR